MTRPEHEEQKEVFRWARANEVLHPELRLLHASMNAAKRSYTEATALKAAGLKAGVPDIILPVPKGHFAGCWVELKAPARDGTPGGSATDIQLRWIDELRFWGNYATVAIGARQAITVLQWYLKL